MYQVIGNTIAITVNDWCAAGLSKNMFEHDSKNGYLSIARRGLHGNTMIDVRSIKRPERLRVIEAKYGPIDASKKIGHNIFQPELDTAARDWFLRQAKTDGSPISNGRLTEYVNRATLLNAVREGLAKQTIVRARAGERVKMGDFYATALAWYRSQAEGSRDENGFVVPPMYECQSYKNVRSFERVFKAYLNGGYRSLLDGRDGNDNARKVSLDTKRLLLGLYRSEDKPFVQRVHELYMEFISGNRDFFDKKTGEVFQPEDFRYKDGRGLELSVATVWNYLKDVVSFTSIYADRNGHFDYMTSQRPKQKRYLGAHSLSKISMDDVVLSRKSVRGWVAKYIAVDVVSGYYFRPAYVVGKPTLGTVYEAFRNMFCELNVLGLPMPGELEVEHHLMKDIPWLNELFPFVRFCSSPTEKRAEHNIKSLKYGAAKDAGHTRGRWYANHEAYRAIRNKVSGDFVEPEYQPQQIIIDDLADIERHNNELHPLQKRFPGKTRRQVMLENINPKLLPIDNRYLYRFIGNEAATTINNNDYVLCANGKFDLVDFNHLKRLKPNNCEVTAYWLPEEDGGIVKVYLYQGDVFIGEAVDASRTAYNECAFERTEQDEANMLHQNKRMAKFDKFIKDERAEIPAVSSLEASTIEALKKLPPIKENITQTVICADDDIDFSNWGAEAISRL